MPTTMAGWLCCLWIKYGCSASSVAEELSFFPPPRTYDVQKIDGEYKVVHLSQKGPSDENVSIVKLFTLLGNQIPGFLFRQTKATVTILFSHGNATDVGAMFHRYKELSKKLNVNVFAYEYSGYGVSSGKTSEKNVYADILAAYNYCCENICPAKQLIVMGQSVGSVPSIYLASQGYPMGGLIILSGIASGMRVLTQNRLLSCWDVYPNVERIVDVTCPVMIIHGLADREVKIFHGKELHAAVPDEFKRPPYYPEKCGHNNVGQTPQSCVEYYRRIELFISSLKDEQDSEEEIEETEQLKQPLPMVENTESAASNVSVNHTPNQDLESS